MLKMVLNNKKSLAYGVISIIAVYVLFGFIMAHIPIPSNLTHEKNIAVWYEKHGSAIGVMPRFIDRTNIIILAYIAPPLAKGIFQVKEKITFESGLQNK